MGDAERRKQSFATGYLLGLSGMPLAIAPAAVSVEPLAFSYNGTPLPPLEWDKKTYPYGVIYYIFQETGVLYYFSVYKRINYFKSGLFVERNYFGSSEDGTALVFTYSPGEDGWTKMERTSWSFGVDRDEITSIRTTIVIWTNFDLMYSDNTLYMGASEPSPITDAEPWKGKYFFNGVVLPRYSDEGATDGWHHLAIMKHETEDAYIFFDAWSSLLYVDRSSDAVILSGRYDPNMQVYICRAGGNRWEGVPHLDYVEERDSEYFDGRCCYIGRPRNLMWVEDDIYRLEGDGVSMYGSEPVPVVFSEPEDIPANEIDNKTLMLGCRLGYIVRQQMGKGETGVPMELDEPSDEPVAYLDGTP